MTTTKKKASNNKNSNNNNNNSKTTAIIIIIIIIITTTVGRRRRRRMKRIMSLMKKGSKLPNTKHNQTNSSCLQRIYAADTISRSGYDFKTPKINLFDSAVCSVHPKIPSNAALRRLGVVDKQSPCVHGRAAPDQLRTIFCENQFRWSTLRMSSCH